MQERVIQLVSILIKKLVEKGQDPSALLTKLAESGFSQEEIHSALELVYSTPDPEEGKAYLRQRVLLPQERSKLDSQAQEFLYQLLEQGLLRIDEFELVLWQASLLEHAELGRPEREFLLANVIGDPERLFLTGIHLRSLVQGEEGIN